MNFLFWGLTLSLIGKVLVAVGVLLAHKELADERKIDQEVVAKFRLERHLALTGLVFIVVGYIMEIYFYGFTISWLTCSGSECAANVSGSLTQ